ncbi:MAG: DUF3352 domain-containing protein [Actinomycetes bacterium]
MTEGTPGEPVHVGEFVLSSGTTPDVLASPPPRAPQLKKLLANIAAIASVIAVVIAGGGAVVAYRTLAGGGPQPEKYAPGSTFAFAKVDLDPSAGEKVAVYRFARKFPAGVTKRLKNSDDLRDRLLRMVFKNSSDPHIDYDKDIKPWLGARVGVAGFVDAADKPQALGIVAVHDEAEARKSLTRLHNDNSSFAYDVKNDYALLAQSQDVITSAEHQLAKGNLEKQATFHNDLQRLGGGQIITAWADLDRTQHVAGSLLGDLFGGLLSGGVSGFATGPTITTGPPVDVGPPAGTSAPSAACIRQLQRATQDGTSISDPLSKLSARCRREFGFDVTQGSVCCPSIVQSSLSATSPDLKLTGRMVLGVHLQSNYAELVMHVLDAKKAAAKPSVRDLVTGLPNDTVAAFAASGVDSARRSLTEPSQADVTSQLQRSLAAMGVDVKIDDIVSGLGNTVLVSLGNVPRDNTHPLIALRTKPEDRAAANRAISALNRALASHGADVRLLTRDAGNDLVVADDAAYAGKVAQGGHLGDQKQFKQAVGSLDGDVLELGYVDIKRILLTLPDHGGAARALAAVGLSVVQTGDDLALRLRVLAD